MPSQAPVRDFCDISVKRGRLQNMHYVCFISSAIYIVTETTHFTFKNERMWQFHPVV